MSKSPKHCYQLMLLTTWPRGCGWMEAALARTTLLWGFPACIWWGTGNGKGGNQAEVRVLQLSAYQRAGCPFVLSFAGYLCQRDMYPDTVLGGANSWTVIFPKHTLRAGELKAAGRGNYSLDKADRLRDGGPELYLGVVAPYWTRVLLVISQTYSLSVIISIIQGVKTESKRRVTARSHRKVEPQLEDHTLPAAQSWGLLCTRHHSFQTSHRKQCQSVMSALMVNHQAQGSPQP